MQPRPPAACVTPRRARLQLQGDDRLQAAHRHSGVCRPAHGEPCVDVAALIALHALTAAATFYSASCRYVVPPAHRARFEQLMRSLLPDLFRACPEFMRHKVGARAATALLAEVSVRRCELCCMHVWACGAVVGVHIGTSFRLKGAT